MVFRVSDGRDKCRKREPLAPIVAITEPTAAWGVKLEHPYVVTRVDAASGSPGNASELARHAWWWRCQLAKQCGGTLECSHDFLAGF